MGSSSPWSAISLRRPTETVAPSTLPRTPCPAVDSNRSEAYLGDLPHPLKHRSELGAAFRVAEKRLEAVIAQRFALPEAAARVKPLDKALLATERRTFSEVTWHWPELDGAEELDMEIEPWDSARALREFSERYERIDALRRA